jgi:hypothetical protein
LPFNARGVRNNNLLNLTVSPFTEKQPGYAGTDSGGRYARFETPEAGQAAAEKLLGSYIKRGFDTPAEIIGRWAPASENGNASTSNYARYVASGLGIGLNDKVSPQQIPFLAKRMAEFENGGQKAGANLSAFQSAADAVGLNQGAPAFDTSGYDQARQIFGNIAATSMKPFSADYTETPLPELPKPEPLKAPDYTAGDQAFEAAKPNNPFGASPEEQAKGQLKLRRADYFAGMAKALGSIDWSRSVGLGELFAKLGAGALMGAKAGDQEVQDRMDKFDAAMQTYSLALANRDDNKAREAANVANQNVAALNQYARDKWTVQAKEIEKDNPHVVDGVLITKTKMPDGTVRENHTPIDPARRTAALMAQANTAIAQGNASNEYNWQIYRGNQAVAAAAFPYAIADASSQGNIQGRDGMYAVGLAEAANAVTETGRWTELYQRFLPGGAQAAASRQREAYAAAGIPTNKDGQLMPGTKIDKDAQEVINNYLSSKVIEDFVNSGKGWVLKGGEIENQDTKERKYNAPAQPVISSLMTTREREKKVSRRTDSKGRTTTTESY